MANKIKSNYERLAQALGLRFDAEGGAVYGMYSNYHVLIYPLNDNAPYALTATISARRASGPLTKEECKQFRKEHKPVQNLVQNGNTIAMSLRNISKIDALCDTMRSMLLEFTNLLRAQGFTDCCQSCGAPAPAASYVFGSYMNLCQGCHTQLQQEGSMKQASQQSKRENILGGIVGALLGSLLGVASIVILGQLGYVAAVSGLIMAICTLKGYELLGGKLSNKGLVISIVLMLLMTLVGCQLDWAILVAKELEIDLFSAFMSVPMLISLEVIELGVYITNLVMLYLFAVLGAIPTIRSTMHSRSVAHKIYRLDASDYIAEA